MTIAKGDGLPKVMSRKRAWGYPQNEAEAI
jgi:hypothetical protein